MTGKWRLWLESLTGLLLPRYCCVCGRRLQEAESVTCVSCLACLPRTHLEGRRGNVVERLFWDDRLCVRRANSFLYYQHESPFSNIYFHFKYFGHPQVAVAYGRMIAQELAGTDFFEGMDALVPIPLSARRLRQRGYNQSDLLAQGISEVTGLPVNARAVRRVVDNPTQTLLSPEERVKNVRGIFAPADRNRLSGRHVLLVDDIITTGGTVRACAHALVGASCAGISVLSLGFSAWHRPVRYPEGVVPGFR